MTKKTKKKDLTPKTIIRMLELHKNDICRYGVKKIGLFGSYAKRSQQRGSDLDFLIVLDKPTFDNYIELKFLLEKMFNKKVDLVIEQNLKPALEHIKREALYAKGL